MAPALEIESLTTHIKLQRSVVRAVEDVSFSIEAGETLGLVGESGCGKSMTGLSIMRLLPPNGRIVSGSVLLDGRDLVSLSDKAMRDIRGNEVAMIFQDSLTSLNPTMPIGKQIAELVKRHRDVTPADATARAVEVLGLVGFPRPEDRIRDYAHQLSGGQRQRVMIAMALACDPTVLIADEPTTALDVTIQAQILQLLAELKDRLGMAVLLITHDMGVVAGRADRVNVMYAGRLVETAPTVELFTHMHHPYTQSLLASIPLLTQQRNERLFSIPGIPPDLTNPPPGCRFAPRCSYATERCHAEEPMLIGDRGHLFACWHPVDGPLPRRIAAPTLVAAAVAVAGNGATIAANATATARNVAAAVGNIAAHAGNIAAHAGDVAAAAGNLAASGGNIAAAAGDVAAAAGNVAAAAGNGSVAGTSNGDDSNLLVLDDVVREFPVSSGLILQRQVASVKAVSGVSLSVGRGETFGLVGESGCGKTTLGKIIVALEKPDRGRAMLRGTDVARLRKRELRKFRRDLQMMFQDPIASLDPRMRVGAILREPMAIQGIGSHKSQDRVIRDLLGEVGLPATAVERFPHEFSGGQRQRIGLARALTLNPQVIVADEPVSALDVSIRSQVLNLMKRLQSTHGLTYMVISHDLSVVKYLADRIGVMYLGKLVEFGPCEDVYRSPAHHYTAGLIAAIPEPDPTHEKTKKNAGISGELPSAINPPSGCRFRTRCPAAQEICAVEEPPLRPFGPAHEAACHFPLATPLAG